MNAHDHDHEPDARLLTDDDLAARWGVDRATARRIVEANPDLPVLDLTALRTGRKPGRPVGGGSRRGPKALLRYRPEDVAAWEARHARTSLAAVPAATRKPPKQAAAPAKPDALGLEAFRARHGHRLGLN